MTLKKGGERFKRRKVERKGEARERERERERGRDRGKLERGEREGERGRGEERNREREGEGKRERGRERGRGDKAKKRSYLKFYERSIVQVIPGLNTAGLWQLTKGTNCSGQTKDKTTKT